MDYDPVSDEGVDDDDSLLLERLTFIKAHLDSIGKRGWATDVTDAIRKLRHFDAIMKASKKFTSNPVCSCLTEPDEFGNRPPNGYWGEKCKWCQIRIAVDEYYKDMKAYGNSTDSQRK